MGDSLAAGEGGGNYLTGSDAERQRCHRSAAAWFAETAAEVTNVACSRATSQNLTVPQQDPQYNLRAEPAQLAATAGRAADITMVMVGGNDIRFAEIFNQCVLAENDCSSDPAFAARALRAAEALPATLARAYRAVAARTDGKAVLVPAYPQFFSESAAECGRISTAEAGLARELTAALNRSARQGAEDAAGTYPGVHFVADTEGALTGHGACDADPFVHTVLPTALIGAVQDPAAAQELLHPTAAGYGKLTEVLTRWLAKHPSVITSAP
jgi:lysophospholipase L1-like esterase